MADLNSKIKIYLGRNFSMEEVLLQDDMVDGVSNPYIKEWNVDEAQPTEEQLNALESQADELETANQIISNRKSEYPTIEECVHAILDDDLENLQISRQAVKNKFPKENA